MSEAKRQLILEGRRAVRKFGTTINAPWVPARVASDRELLYPDLSIHLDESFRIFLSGEIWELVYEDDENGEQELLVTDEELEANYVEALRRLRKNTVLDELARL